jgi:hypothetical protein
MSEHTEALTEAEKLRMEQLEALCRGEYSDARPEVVRVEHEGRQRAVVVAVKRLEDGSVFLDPVAMLIDEEMAEAISLPEG